MAALAKNGMNDSLTPSRTANSSLTVSRSLEMAVTSTSTTVVSCALTRSDSTIRSAITLRSLDIGSVFPRNGDGTGAPGDGSAGAAGSAVAGCAAAAAAAEGCVGVVS